MDKYRLRRAIVEAVEAQEPGLASADDVAAYPLLRMGSIDADTLMDAIRGLVEHGYVSDVRPGREPLLRMTGKGRDQIRQDADLDEYIWGEMASQFHKQ
jgi:hypothetical protein